MKIYKLLFRGKKIIRQREYSSKRISQIIRLFTFQKLTRSREEKKHKRKNIQDHSLFYSLSNVFERRKWGQKKL